MQNTRFEQTVSVLSDAGSRCPESHKPLATLTIEWAWLRQPPPAKDRSRKNRGTSALVTGAVMVIMLLAAGGVFLAMTYLSGQLMKEMQRVQQNYQPQAQYSDVWKWQGHR
jgi:hypothetical protein